MPTRGGFQMKVSEVVAPATSLTSPVPVRQKTVAPDSAEMRELEAMLVSPSLVKSPRYSRRIAGLEPAAPGYGVNWETHTPVIDHASLVQYGYEGDMSMYLQAIMLPKEHSHQVTLPGHYLCLEGDAAMSPYTIQLPLMVELTDPTETEPVMLVCFIARGPEEAPWVVAAKGGEWTCANLTKIPFVGGVSKLIGPPQNDAGMRRHLTHANSLFSKYPPFQACALIAYDKCEELIGSINRKFQFEMVFNAAELDMRAKASKVKGAKSNELEMIDTFMPLIEAARSAFDAALPYYNKPLANRVTVLGLEHAPAKGFTGDEVMVDKAMNSIYLELECCALLHCPPVY